MAATRRKIQIREATLADIPRLADICSEAFLKDELHDALFPKRHEFYKDYRDSWCLRLRRRFLGVGEIYILVEADVEENGRIRKEIVGWGEWYRMGSSEAAKKVTLAGEFLLRRLERKFVYIEDRYLRPLLARLLRDPGDRSLDPEALQEYIAGEEPNMKKYWSGETEEHWHLKMLAIDPRWQRQGVGQMLVRWGLERAQAEGVAAGLGASTAGEPLYLKLGFVPVGRRMAARGVTFPIMVWKPRREDAKDVNS